MKRENQRLSRHFLFWNIYTKILVGGWNRMWSRGWSHPNRGAPSRPVSSTTVLWSKFVACVALPQCDQKRAPAVFKLECRIQEGDVWVFPSNCVWVRRAIVKSTCGKRSGREGQTLMDKLRHDRETFSHPAGVFKSAVGVFCGKKKPKAQSM